MSLTIHYPGKSASTPVAVDIVAVHGLGGDPIKTWTHPKSKAFWLKDFLPEQIPDARVMSFGYNADAAFGKSTAEIIDHAKSLLSSLVDKRDEPEETNRPLIFIAHSLGGIVVKQALLQARLESRYQSIRDSTLGLIFLGTPHRGSDKATYGKVLSDVAQFMIHRPPSKLLTALQTNSDVLQRLTTDFRFQLPDYHVFSFYEQRPMKGLSHLIVEKHSALLDVPHEEQIPVDTDHSAMCKFEGEEDDTFEKVYKRIRRMRNSPRHSIQEQQVSKNEHFEVPHLLSPVFTGRDDDLQSLQNAFTSGHTSNSQHRFVLFGLGGSGKTQICLKFLQDHRERYWGVFWIDATTENSIQQSFTQISHLLKVDKEIYSVRRKLANISQTWILVFDNADDPRLSLTPYLPWGNRGDIIITSRNPGIQQYSTSSREIGKLSIDDSVSLLNKTIFGMTNWADHDAEDRQKVVETLGCLALAIVHAGAYIRETGCTIQEYLQMYDRSKSSLLQRLPSHIGTDYRYSVYATWQVSIDRLESMQDTASSDALRLLSLLGFYHYDQIPVKMFYLTWRNVMKTETDVDLPWTFPFPDFPEYQQAIQMSISLLVSFSLVSRSINGSLNLHPLVHEWCRDRISQNEQVLSYEHAVFLVRMSVASPSEASDHAFLTTLVPHVFELLRWTTLIAQCNEYEKILAWPWFVRILDDNGWGKQATLLLENLIQLQKSEYGGQHIQTMISLHSLSIKYTHLGRYSEARQISEQVVEGYETTFGEDHPDTLARQSALVRAYVRDEQHTKALQLSEKVLSRLEKVPAEDESRLTTIQELAVAYNEMGRYSEAIQLAEDVLRLRTGKQGADHPETLRTRMGLISIYLHIGRETEALQLTEDTLSFLKNKLGEDHWDTLATMQNLAIIYGHEKRWSEAFQLMETIIKKRKARLGEDHPETLSAMHNLACTYYETGQLAKAIELMAKVVDLYTKTLGENHRDTKKSIGVLANFREQAAEKALKEVEESTGAQVKTKPPDKAYKAEDDSLDEATKHPEESKASESQRLLNEPVTEPKRSKSPQLLDIPTTETDISRSKSPRQAYRHLSKLAHRFRSDK